MEKFRTVPNCNGLNKRLVILSVVIKSGAHCCIYIFYYFSLYFDTMHPFLAFLVPAHCISPVKLFRVLYRLNKTSLVQLKVRLEVFSLLVNWGKYTHIFPN